MYRIKLPVLIGMVFIAVILFLCRGYFAVSDLGDGDQTSFLAFPLSVILPVMVFSFLATRRTMVSQEGALMQLGAMVQILLIIALPRFALYLALGFPVVFLLVELFETKIPSVFKTAIKSRLLA
ncbi:MAG: hypothetical protein ABJP82_22315 [Hyphomicrobiales bacterium]